MQVEEKKLSIFARFLTPGDIDRFLFYLPLPGNIIIEAVAETDLQLLLFRGGEEIPFTAQPSRIEEHLPPGIYILEVTADDFDLEAGYQLLINLAAIGDDSYEPDDTLEEANEIFSVAQRCEALPLPCHRMGHAVAGEPVAVVNGIPLHRRAVRGQYLRGHATGGCG